MAGTVKALFGNNFVANSDFNQQLQTRSNKFIGIVEKQITLTRLARATNPLASLAASENLIRTIWIPNQLPKSDQKFERLSINPLPDSPLAVSSCFIMPQCSILD